MAAYFAQVAVMFIACSAIFWGLSCASLAVRFNLRHPMVHLGTGTFFHVLGFVVVGGLCLAASRKNLKAQRTLNILESSQIGEASEW
jgi:hypothetical protein